MFSGIQGLLETTWKYATRVDCAFGFFLIIALVLATVFGIEHHPILLDHLVAWCVGTVAIYFIAIIPPVKRMAARRHELVTYVAVWGIVSLTVFVVAFYFVYFAVTDGKEPDGATWDRLLNFPPVIAAVVGAAIGWYVHQQMQAKFHRTTNSFNLVMQTRTNSEFINHFRKFASVYPSTREVPPEHSPYFLPSKRGEIDEIGEKVEHDGASITKEQALEYWTGLRYVEAIEGLKYLLNFYEFLALGIKLGDLDDSLLYETISPSVVGLYERSKAYRMDVRKRASDKLAFQHLECLVCGYTEAIGRRTVNIEGWAKRLEREKADL